MKTPLFLIMIMTALIGLGCQPQDKQTSQKQPSAQPPESLAVKPITSAQASENSSPNPLAEPSPMPKLTAYNPTAILSYTPQSYQRNDPLDISIDITYPKFSGQGNGAGIINQRILSNISSYMTVEKDKSGNIKAACDDWIGFLKKDVYQNGWHEASPSASVEVRVRFNGRIISLDYSGHRYPGFGRGDPFYFSESYTYQGEAVDIADMLDPDKQKEYIKARDKVLTQESEECLSMLQEEDSYAQLHLHLCPEGLGHVMICDGLDLRYPESWIMPVQTVLPLLKEEYRDLWN